MPGPPSIWSDSSSKDRKICAKKHRCKLHLFRKCAKASVAETPSSGQLQQLDDPEHRKTLFCAESQTCKRGTVHGEERCCKRSQ